MAFKKVNTRKTFIGRTNELHFFIENILNPEIPHYNIISISGQGGVGKTTLLNHFIDIASTSSFKNFCLTALVNENQVSPINIMEKFAEQLNIAGKFEKELKQYKETLRKIQNDQGVLQSALLRKMTTNITESVVKNVPLVGEVLEKEAEPVFEYIFSGFHNRQVLKDAERLEDPIRYLTNAFIEELNNLSEITVSLGRFKRQQRIVLFFDTFEHVSPETPSWLLNYFLQAEIDINYEIILIIAGRDSIERSTPNDPKQWLSYRDNEVMHLINLNSFTKEETQSYLNERGIHNQNTIDEIWHLSKGLPLYLSLLTFNSEGNIDPTADVVGNFLRWIPEHERIKRQLALDASMFSAPFNQDDLEAFDYTSDSENTPSSLYQWLIKLPFIKSTQEGRYYYHELAQELFRRYLYQRSQREYYTTCGKLVNYYKRMIDKIQKEEGKTSLWSSEWLNLTLSLAYQLFLLPDEISQINAIDQILTSYNRIKENGELLRLLREISKEPKNIAISANNQICASMLLNYIEAKLESKEFLKTTNYILEKNNDKQLLSQENLIQIYYSQGRHYIVCEEYQQAVNKLDHILELEPKYSKAFFSKGQIHTKLQEHEQALADFTHVIDLDPQYSGAYYNRGLTYQRLQQYQQALADFTHAIDLNPQFSGAYNNRGLTYRDLKQYQQALADFTHAIDLNPQYWGTYNNRGLTYRDLKQYQQALADFTHAIDLNPQFSGAYNNRGLTYRDLKQYQLALADFIHAIDLDPQYSGTYNNRGLTYRDLKQYQLALADFTHAIDLDPQYWGAYNNRGLTYRRLQQYQLALADFIHTIDLNP